MHTGEYIDCLAGIPMNLPLKSIYMIAQYEWFSGMAYDLGKWDELHTHVQVGNMDFGKRAVDFLIPFFKTGAYAREQNIWLVGNQKYQGQIFERTKIAITDTEAILSKYDLEPPQKYEIVVCALSNSEMRKFREFGEGDVIALSGPGTVAFNIDLIDELGIDSPTVLRAMNHEPRHNVVREMLPPIGNERGGILIVPGDYHDSVSHEAFGGLNALSDWSDVEDDDRISFVGLEETDYWKWYGRETKRLAHSQMYFDNPVAKAFHAKYVLGDGRNWEHWIKRVSGAWGETRTLKAITATSF